MKKNIWICLLLLVGSAGSLWAKSERSSEIPDRREFPVSPTVKACDDFYAYACSEAISTFELRKDRSRHIFSFSDSFERILNKKKAFLPKLVKKKGLSPRAQELGDVYSACMNKGERKKEEKRLIRDTVRRVREIKDRKSFQRMLGEEVGKSDFGFLDFWLVANQDRSDWNDVVLTGNTMTLPERSYYKNEKLMKDFEEVAEAFFEKVKAGDAKKRARWLLEYEKGFAETYPLPAEFRKLFTARTGITRDRLIARYSSFEITRFLEQVPPETHIRHMTPENFDYLHNALETYPLEQLKSVYLFHTLYGFMDDAYPKLYAKKFEFSRKHLGGPEKRPEREERCTRWVMGNFGKELDAEIIPVLFPDFPEDTVVELSEEIKATMMKRLRENTWLSEQGRAGALKKLERIRWQLVKPKREEDWGFNLPGDYDPRKPIKNTMQYQNLRNRKKFQDLAKPRNRDEWHISPLTVNAYYSPSDNKFVLLQGILQYPFFDPALSREANLGAMGMVVGHEIGHGFDDNGSKFDAYGKLAPWMTPEDLAGFKERTQKLIKQYDAAGHNGELTQGENIGDVSGMSFAYDTAFPNNEGTREGKRAFFLQFARAWCQVVRPKTLEKLLKTDSHSQHYVRVNEPLKHMPGFYEAYGCGEKDPMYLPPEDRIKLW